MISYLALCAAAFVNVVLALLALLPTTNGGALPPLGFGRVARSAGVVALSTLAMGAVLGRGADGLITLVILDLAIVAPLAGLLVLILHRREHRASMVARVAAVLALALAPVAVYARAVEPFALRLERVDVPLARRVAGSGPVSVGVLADVETRTPGDYEQRAVELLMSGRPDIVLVPGDVLQSGTPSRPARSVALRQLFEGLSAPLGVWVVPGDHDEYGVLASALEDTGARLLLNEWVELTLGERDVLLLGLGHGPEADEALRRFEELPDQGELRLVLVHMPRAVLDLSKDAIVDLVVAGHTHGGQVSLPVIGAVFAPTPLPRAVAAGGLHEVNGHSLYISRGVGVERDGVPPMRLFCPPEVSLLTLR